MFKETGFGDVLAHGGLVLYLLVALSLWSWAIIAERWMKFKRAEAGSERLAARVLKLVRAGQLGEARELAGAEEGCLGRLLSTGLTHGSKDKDMLGEALERKAVEEISGLEQKLGNLGTIGSVAPYIGLFGTVLGIITAFQALARSGQEAGAAMVSAGIAEALVATAAGPGRGRSSRGLLQRLCPPHGGSGHAHGPGLLRAAGSLL